MSALLGVLLGYVALQLAVGVVVSRRIRGEDDYLLAGRKLGPLLTTASIFATWFGAETCVGAAAEVYSGGLRLSLSDPFGYATCLLLFGLLLAVPLYRLRLTTLADLFRRRFSPGVERLAALLLIPTSLFWASAQVRAFGRVIAWGTSLSAETGVAIAAATACLYTAFGGLLADAYADLIQGTVLCVCLVLLSVTVVSDVGVAQTGTLLLDAGRSAADAPLSWHMLDAWAVPVLGSLFAQELLSRAVASSSERVAKRAAISAAAIYLLVGSMPLLLGAIARATLPDADPEAVLSALSHKHLGTWGYVVLTGALVSAILSTVDSALLVASSFVSHNLAPAIRPDLSDRQRLVIARCAVVGLAIVAYAFARGEGTVHELVTQASAFGTAGICVVGGMALFTRVGGVLSAYAALILGSCGWFCAKYLWDTEGAFSISLLLALVGYLGGALFQRAAAPRLRGDALS